MARLGLGLGVASRRGRGAPWTLGDTSPVLWTRADANVTSAGTPALVSAWGDVRVGVAYTWEQATDGSKFSLATDARGSGLVSAGGKTMSCHAAAALASAPNTVAIALEKDATDATQLFWAFRNSAGGLRAWMGVYRNAPQRFTLDRIRDDSNTVQSTAATTLPFAGTVIGRYTGAALLLRVNGTDAAPVAQTGALTTDRLWLGSYDGSILTLSGVVREIAIWDRALSDPEAAAVDVHLRTAWGY